MVTVAFWRSVVARSSCLVFLSATVAAASLSAVVAGLSGCSPAPRKAVLPDASEIEDRLRQARELQTKADQARRKGNQPEAIDLYRRSLGLDGSNFAAWHNLGTLLMEQKDYMAAAGALRAAADLAPTDPRPLESLGLTYFRAGYDDQALRHYMESLDRDPTRVESIRGVAMCAYRLNRADDDILEILRRGSMVEPDAKWRTMIHRERVRVEQQIKAEKESARREGR